MYVTLDTGHQSGQALFQRPRIEDLIASLRAGVAQEPGWPGTDRADELFRCLCAMAPDISESAVMQFVREIESRPELFADTCDSDPYIWIEELGCCSPIIHLQQTDGQDSAHKSFTPDNNASGIIHGERVLEALQKAFSRSGEKPLPACEDIYLTLEIVSGTTAGYSDILKNLKKSVVYWRHFIPEDGMQLFEL